MVMSVGSILAHKGDRSGKSRCIFDLVGYILYKVLIWGRIMLFRERRAFFPSKYY